MRRQVPLVLCFLFGITMTIQYYVPSRFSEDLKSEVLNWGLIIGPFALVLAIATLVRLHYTRIQRRSENWPYSIVVFVGLIVMAVVGTVQGFTSQGISGGPFEWIFNNIQVPMDATMFALLAFFIASAAYRAFRARTLEATLLLVAALLVMFGNAPIGDLIWQKISPVRPNLPSEVRQWILDNPNLSSRRAIIMGISLGAISQSLRIILGIERSYLGGGE